MESERAVSVQRLDVVIGLGANLGDARRALARATRALARIGEVSAVSALYETLPVGGPPQPNYLNAAVRMSVVASPPDLLARLLELERDAGRERRERWGPRCLDLDILWIDGMTCNEVGLTVPHAHLRDRAFALMPLLDVAPSAVDPTDGCPYARVLADLGTRGVAQLERDWVGQVSG